MYLLMNVWSEIDELKNSDAPKKSNDEQLNQSECSNGPESFNDLVLIGE